MTNRFKRIKESQQDPEERIKNFDEVSFGYNKEEAIMEAKRCLNCKNKPCVNNCPVSIDIPKFISYIAEGQFEEASRVLAQNTTLPAICGRVCPQEDQCEKNCILGIKGDAVAIGKLERFAADWARENKIELFNKVEKNGHKVAIIGSGPAGLTCAGELAKMGYEVKIFEALHRVGGVLVYGIPEFRLPKDKIISSEINNLKTLGVKIEKNVVVGRTVALDDLFEEGFEAIFIASGAGLPRFMGIEGENINGVFSANEFLTRINLMKAFRNDYDTPIKIGKRTVVIGGGNVAIDAARTALRLGSDVKVIYRRRKEDLPARIEEVEHAIEEGIKFEFLSNPIKIEANKDNNVSQIICRKIRLVDSDNSGILKPVEVVGSEYSIKTDTIIMAIGTNPNPLIANESNIKVNDKGCILVDDKGRTSKKGVFAGGDIVTGAATVILAMEAGKNIALNINNFIKNKD